MMLFQIKSLKHTNNYYRMNFKKGILLSVVALLSQMSFAQQSGDIVDGIAGVIGKNVILVSDVEKGLMQYQAQGVAVYDGMECKVFEDLMVEKLLVHQAVTDSIVVSDDEVKSSVDQRLQMLVSRVGSMKELEKFYNKEEDELRDEMFDILKDQLLAQRMQQEIIADVDITPEEVREFFNSIPKEELPQFGTEVVMAHIMKKPILSKETKEETIAKLNKIRAEILQGSSFKTKAILYSEDPGSSAKGGAYFGVRKGQFVKPFEEAAFNLQEGEISEPVETEFGFHIIQLIKRKGEELDLRHILIKPVIRPQDLEETELALDSIRAKVLREELVFEKAAEEFSDDENTKFNDGIMINPRTGDTHFELNHIDRAMYFKVEALEVGDISTVIYLETERGEQQFSIVKLIDRIEPHVADFSKDYQKIKQMALAKKKERISEEWVQKHIKKAYIRISGEYRKCEYKNEWLEYTQS